MCGIVGFLQDSPQLDFDRAVAVASAMATAIGHRGPDGSGVWVDADAGLALGHRRLAVVDRSVAGYQPMASESKRYQIVFNGEIYNHRELRSELEDKGESCHWRGYTDTETLLACISAWGFESSLRRVHGMFAFSVWDRDERVLYLARDRMGEKPLYYGRVGQSFVFGSELRALRAHPEFDCEIDRGAVALVLKHSFVPAPYSIFKGIYKLPPASFLKVRAPNFVDLSPTSYWSFATVAEQGAADPFDDDINIVASELECLLGDVVESQMLSDVPLGAFLSGGVDSSLIVALMQSRSSRPLRTFSIGFDESMFDEGKYAAAVAHHIGTEHREFVVTQTEALQTAVHLPAIYDEPFADSSQIPTVILSRFTRDHVTVALSGDGADELFGGYNRYIWARRLWERIDRIPKPFRSMLGKVLQAASVLQRDGDGEATLAARLGLPITLFGKLAKVGSIVECAASFEDMYIRLISEWSEVDDMVLGAIVPKVLATSPESWPRIADPAALLMSVDSLTYLPDDILTKVDRGSMAASLETRAPYLDVRIVEFAWRLPLSMKVSQAQSKRVLRRILDRYVPPRLVKRPKQGFAIPLNKWLRGGLRDWAEDLLSEERLKATGFFSIEPVRSAWRLHHSGRRQYGARLWPVLMLQAWLAENK